MDVEEQRIQASNGGGFAEVSPGDTTVEVRLSDGIRDIGVMFTERERDELAIALYKTEPRTPAAER